MGIKRTEGWEEWIERRINRRIGGWMGGRIKDGTMNQNRRMEGRNEGWDMWKKDRKDK